ncbi:DUF6233 domain-containing protein [Streptomyces sp. NPDC005151]
MAGWTSGKRRRMLADGVEACPYCNPDNTLGVTA